MRRSRATILLKWSNERSEKTVNIVGFLSATTPFATIRGTLFAGMPRGRILRIASELRRGCVTKTLRSGSKSIRHPCLRRLWARHRPCKPFALQPGESSSHRLHGAYHWRNRHRKRTNCSRHSQALATFRPGVHQRKLCFDSFLLDRVGTVWPRKRCLHRRGPAPPRPL